MPVAYRIPDSGSALGQSSFNPQFSDSRW